MHIAHKIELSPNKQQVEYFKQACGTTRFVWNWALSEWDRQYRAGEKPSAMKLKKQFNAIKYQQFPWLEFVHRDAHAAPFLSLGKSFVSFFRGVSKHPRFHKKGTHDSFQVANDTFRIDERKVRLPVVGWVKMKESLRFEGKILSGTVSRIADRWFLSVSLSVDLILKPKTGEKILGVDLGIKTTVATSDGRKLQGPKSLSGNLRRLRVRSRRLSRKIKGSRNGQKAKLRLARLHYRIVCQRNDFIHKTTTMLVRESQAIGIEDLSVENMMKNRCLARQIADAAWSEMRWQFGYKSLWYNTRLHVVDRFYPSSKTCSGCGYIKKDLKLSDRMFKCDSCGLVIDRDVNAARNLEMQAKLPTVSREVIPVDGQINQALVA